MPVVARATVRVGGFREIIYRGRSYADDHPIVVARPDLFMSSDDDVKRRQRPKSTLDLAHRQVESARKAPGEQRAIDYPCDDCDYQATSEHGLKVHRAKTHK